MPTTLELVATKDQQEILNYRGKFCLVIAGRRWGKRLHVDTMLPTPTGFIRNGDVAAGTILIGSNGRPITVTRAHDISVSSNCYKLTFDDGEEIIADGEHLWSVIDKRERKRLSRSRGNKASHMVIDTDTIARSVKSKCGESNYAIPVVRYVGSRADLPVHPYMLGVWLGDGYRCSPSIICGKDDAPIFIRLRKLGYKIGKTKWNKPMTRGAGWHPTFYYYGLSGKLNSLGLMGESYASGKRKNISKKRIPEMYFHSSVHQRMDLLRGLMDTDGYCDGVRCEICLSDKDLAKDVLRLIKGLGIKARSNENESYLRRDDGHRVRGQNRHRIVFYRRRGQPRVFTLKQKRDKIPYRSKGWQHQRFIVSCERCDPAPMRCLTVDAADHLYCATESFIATHNSVGVVCNHIFSRCLEAGPVEYLVVAPSMPQVKQLYDMIAGNRQASAYIKSLDRRHYPIITWHNGSRTHFRTLDQPELLRGAAYDYVWIDEIQNVSEKVIDTILLPTLADRRGRLGMSGQGRGEEHWIYQRFYAPGQDARNHSWIRSWSFSISQGMRFQDEEGKAELARLKAVTPPAVWDEEYEGKFVSSGKSVFASQNIQACLRGTLLEGPVSGRSYIMAIDLGRVADPSAWLILDPKDNQVVHAEIRPLREHHSVAAKVAEGVRRRWNEAVCLIDKTGYGYGSASRIDEYIRQYEGTVKRLVPVFLNLTNKRRIIDRLALTLEQGRVGIPESARELRRQLAIYEYSKRGEQVVSHAPSGDHDDLVVALAMAVDAAATGYSGHSGELAKLAAVLG